MILIIDNYTTPAHRIKEFLYKDRLLKPFSGTTSSDAVYFVHAECVEDPDRYRHLAEEIVEVWETRLVVVNKRRRCAVFYRIEGKSFVKEDAAQNAPCEEHRGRHLPHLLAQDDEAVTFPSDGEE
eukprot:jgi/Antlo1/2117/2231